MASGPETAGGRGPWPSHARIVVPPAWPPAPVTLPDHLLGRRISGRFLVGSAPVRGNSKGPVEVLYFTPLAKEQARQTLEGLLATYGGFVRVVAKVMPYGAGPPTPPTLLAEAALYAHAQGKFWPFHDAFTQDVPRPDRARVFEVARQIGLDLEDLGAALDSGRFRAAAEEETAALDDAGIHDVAFVVDGRLASGTVALAQLVEDAVRKAGGQPPPRPMPAPRAPTPDPAQDGYDSAELLATMSPAQIFSREPRDEAWAAAAEQQLAPLIAGDLRAVDPKVARTGIECRTTICRLYWQLPGRDPRQLGHYAAFFYSGAGAPRDQDLNQHHVILRRPGENSADAGVARLKARRASIIHSVRTGRPANGLRWPLDRLPR